MSSEIKAQPISEMILVPYVRKAIEKSMIQHCFLSAALAEKMTAMVANPAVKIGREWLDSNEQ